MEEEVAPEEVEPEPEPPLGQVLDHMMLLVDKRFALLEERIETGEQHMAELTKSYMEINAHLESLLHHIFGTGDSPEAERYRKTVSEVKAAMLGWLDHAAEHLATGDDSLNEAVLRLVREESGDPGATAGSPSGGDPEAPGAGEGS